MRGPRNLVYDYSLKLILGSNPIEYGYYIISLLDETRKKGVRVFVFLFVDHVAGYPMSRFRFD